LLGRKEKSRDVEILGGLWIIIVGGELEQRGMLASLWDA